MPVYQVTDPDTGVKLKLTGDSPPTEAELVDIFSKFNKPEKSFKDKAVDLVGEGYKTFKNTVSGTATDIKEAVAPSDVEDLPELKTIGSIAGDQHFQLADTPQGMLNIVNSKRRDYRGRNPEDVGLDNLPMTMGEDKYGNPVAVDVEGNKFHFNKPGLSLNDADYVKKGVDKYAPLIVGGQVAAPAKMLAGTAVSGVTGALSELGGQAASVDEGSGESINLKKVGATGLLSAGGEFGGRAVAAAVGKVFSMFGSKVDDIAKYVDKDGNLTEKTLELLKKNELDPSDLDAMLKHELGKRGNDILTSEQAGRFNTLKSEGINPTKPQVTQNANDFRMQQELLKSNPDVQNRMILQNARSTGRVPELIEKTGAQANDGSGVVAAITNKRLDMDSEIGAMYKEVRNSSPQKNIIAPRQITSKLKNANNSEMNKGVIGAVEGELKRLGILNKEGSPVLRMNAAYTKAEPVKITVNQAEDLRIFLNSLHDFKNPNMANSLIRELKDSLDSDVGIAGGKDFFNKARNLKKAERAEFASDALKKNKFDRGTKNILDDISSGKIDPDKFTDKVIARSTTPHDIRAIKKSLTTGTKEQVDAGTQALNDLKGEILDKGFIKATQKKGSNGAMWDRDAWKRYITSIGDKKMTELFTGEEMSFLRKLSTIDDLMKPVAGTGLGDGPSTLATNKIIQMMSKFPTGKIALAGKNVLDDAVKPILDASNANKILNPSEATINALKAYSESIRRGGMAAPRVGVAVGAAESK